jgi:hypothetical protein
MKRLTILLFIVIIGVAAVVIATQINTPRKTEAATAASVEQQTTRTINGATNPEMISDHVWILSKQFVYLQ